MQEKTSEAYRALNLLMSRGFCRMTSFVHSFKMPGNSSGTRICSAQYNGSTSIFSGCTPLGVAMESREARER